MLWLEYINVGWIKKLDIALQMNNEYFQVLAKNYYQLSFIVFLMI